MAFNITAIKKAEGEKSSQQKIKQQKELGLTDTLWFGKYKGSAVQDIIWHDPEYVQWCIENVTGFVLNNHTFKQFQDAQQEAGATAPEIGILEFGDPFDFGDR